MQKGYKTPEKEEKQVREMLNENKPGAWALKYERAHGRDAAIRFIGQTISLLKNDPYADKELLRFYVKAQTFLANRGTGRAK